ncbi:MAG TPA: 30S ribosomal protein S16 [Nocardioidaceae bacterium]|nr:30S ribosomal protein S16 [Nocardioidaceae bacterium]
MAVKIRLKRMGKVRAPHYRVVVVDSRKKRDGKVIEEIGKYHPKEEPSFIEVRSERAQYWLGVGAQPSEAVAAILKVTGDWQKFKGLPGAEGTLKTAEAKRDKAEIFNEALKEAADEPKGEAVTKKRKMDTPKGQDDAKAAKGDSGASADAAEGADSAKPAATETPAAETPEGATEQAESDEAKQVDAEKQASTDDAKA